MMKNRLSQLVCCLAALAAMLSVALPQAGLALELQSPVMTTVGQLAELEALPEQPPTALTYTESIGAPETFVLTVDDPALAQTVLSVLLSTPVHQPGICMDMAQLQSIDFRFAFGEDALTLTFVPNSYFCHDGKYFELGENQLSLLGDLLRGMVPSAKWYSDDAVLDTRFLDNGDEARSLTVLTLSVGDESLTGVLEGAYDVLSVARHPDGYVIRYTYGDFYHHDAIRTSRITVENGALVITPVDAEGE